MGSGYVVALAAFAAVGSFLFGYDSGVMTNVIASPNFLNYFHTTSTSNIIGAINSTFNGGAAVGALMGGFFADYVARKYSIIIGAFVATIGSAIQAGSQTLVMMLIGRIITGWAVGILSMCVPIYQSECAHPARRGLITGLAQQLIGFGFVVSSWVGYACCHAPDSSTLQWRFPLALQTFPSAVLFVGMWLFPESPRSLCQRGKHDEGLAVLRRLHFDGDNDDWIIAEYKEITSAVEKERAVAISNWTAMFIVPQWRKRFLIACAVQVFTQTTGDNVITYYQTIMYRSLGLSGDTITLMACFHSMVGCTSIFFFITFFLDRVGRRKPLLFGTIGITLALICEGIISSQIEIRTTKVLSGFGILFIWLVTVMFSASFGPISWVYMSEVMPMQVRSVGAALATGIANWGVATLIAQVSPKALDKIGWKYYFVYVAWNILITFPIIYAFFVETKGQSLERMDYLFGGPVDLSRWESDTVASAEKNEVQDYIQNVAPKETTDTAEGATRT